MAIREQAIQWLKINHPTDVLNTYRTSKYYPEGDIWFLTFPTSYFDLGKPGYLNILSDDHLLESRLIDLGR